MSAVPARAGQHKMFQDIFLNQGAEQLCLPAQARYKDDIRISDQLIPRTAVSASSG